MSEENIETIRRCDEAISPGDVEAFLLGIHPEIEFIPRRAAVQGTYHGHAGMKKFIADNAESYDRFEVSNDEFRDLGDRVVAFGTVRIRGREAASR